MNTDKQEWLKKRLDDITSTEVSALFGLSPYSTEFELWHRKKSREVVELASNERMVWGSRLESAIAGGIASDQGWEVSPPAARQPVLARVPLSYRHFFVFGRGAFAHCVE